MGKKKKKHKTIIQRKLKKNLISLNENKLLQNKNQEDEDVQLWTKRNKDVRKWAEQLDKQVSGQRMEGCEEEEMSGWR